MGFSSQIGTVISTYLDNSKTALIIAFTVWVFAVLITPRVGFLAAKFIAPTQTSQSVYLEKTALRENFNAELEEKKAKIHQEFWKDRQQPSFDEQIANTIAGGISEVDKEVQPVEEEFRQKFKESADEIDRRYKRDKARQESVGEMLSRITPTSSLIYLTNKFNPDRKNKKRQLLSSGSSLL